MMSITATLCDIVFSLYSSKFVHADNPQLLKGPLCSKGTSCRSISRNNNPRGESKTRLYEGESRHPNPTHMLLRICRVSLLKGKTAGKLSTGISPSADCSPSLGRRIAHSGGEQAARQRRDDCFLLRDLKKTTSTLKISLICCFYTAGRDGLWCWYHTASSCSCCTDSGNG